MSSAWFLLLLEQQVPSQELPFQPKALEEKTHGDAAANTLCEQEINAAVIAPKIVGVVCYHSRAG